MGVVHYSGGVALRFRLHILGVTCWVAASTTS